MFFLADLVLRDTSGLVLATMNSLINGLVRRFVALIGSPETLYNRSVDASSELLTKVQSRVQATAEKTRQAVTEIVASGEGFVVSVSSLGDSEGEKFPELNPVPHVAARSSHLSLDHLDDYVFSKGVDAADHQNRTISPTHGDKASHGEKSGHGEKASHGEKSGHGSAGSQANHSDSSRETVADPTQASSPPPYAAATCGQSSCVNGMFNLFVLLLVMLNARLIVENIIKYGVLIKPLTLVSFLGGFPAGVVVIGCLVVLPVLSFWNERLFYKRAIRIKPSLSGVQYSQASASPDQAEATSTSSSIVEGRTREASVESLKKRKVPSKDSNVIDSRSVPASIKTGKNVPSSVSASAHSQISSLRKTCSLIHCGIILVLLIVPYWFVTRHIQSLNGMKSGILLGSSVVYAMKLISFAHVMAESCSGSSVPRVSFAHFVRFLVYPTLCFQFSYPRHPRVNKVRLIKLVLSCVALAGLITLIAEQYAVPVLENTKKACSLEISQRNVTFLAERLLKLSVPTLYMWLLFFVGYFHFYLNLLAELTGFADRLFYMDWWNAVSLRDYWQKWNLPVHYWIQRHLYRPLRKCGVNRVLVGLIVFLISGLLHEYLIVVPLGLQMNGSVTLGFILQLPLIVFTDTRWIKSSPTLGNVIFWFVFCFTGQPLGLMINFLAKYGCVA